MSEKIQWIFLWQYWANILDWQIFEEKRREKNIVNWKVRRKKNKNGRKIFSKIKN